MEEEHSQIQKDIINRMTPEQRLKAAENLYWSARKLKAAGIKLADPHLTESEIEQRVKKIFMYARS